MSRRLTDRSVHPVRPRAPCVRTPQLWGRGDHVQCIHPGSACVATAEHVIASWELIFSGEGNSGYAIELEDVRVMAHDDMGVLTW